MSLLQRIPAKKLQLAAIFTIAIYPIVTLLIRTDAMHFRNGFLLFAIATLAAFIVLVFAVLKLARADASENKALLVSIVLSALPLAYMGSNIVKANQYPFIHDITTDTAQPPMFTAAAELRSADDHPITYDANLAEVQQAGYPDLKALRVNRDAQAAFTLAKAALLELGMEITAQQETVLPYTLEAVDTTMLLGFKDDIVLRIKQTDDGQTVIDARSKSRVGKSDLGKNAQRIQNVFAHIAR